MMQTGPQLLTAFVLVALFVVPAPDITGKWATTIDTMEGPMSYTYEFKVEGTKLTGTATTDKTPVSIAQGTVEDNRVSFVEVRDFPGLGRTVIAYSCDITTADVLSCHRDVGVVASEDFTIERAK
jgi:hypothetical protein